MEHPHKGGRRGDVEWRDGGRREEGEGRGKRKKLGVRSRESR